MDGWARASSELNHSPFAVVHSQSLWLSYWPQEGGSSTDAMELVELPLANIIDLEPALGHPMPGN